MPAFCHEELGVSLYQADCVSFMEEIARKHPSGLFDMIFADPPYSLSNGGTTCHAGKRVKVDKGKWDQSRGSLELNHQYNLLWLGLRQKLLKQNGTIWVSGTASYNLFGWVCHATTGNEDSKRYNLGKT